MEEYTNRELGIMLSEMKNDTREILERIELKVDKTNGRVTRLEKWRVFLAGGQAVFLFLLPLIAFLLIQWITNIQKQMSADTQQLINMAIQEYDEKNFEPNN